MQQPAPDPAAAQAMAMAMLPFIGFGILVVWAIVIIPFWQIFKKAGMAAPLSLLMLIPVVNLIMLYVLAFSRWNVVPAADYSAGYLPPAYPPGYTPAAPAYPAQTVYPAAPPAHVPPPDPPSTI